MCAKVIIIVSLSIKLDTHPENEGKRFVFTSKKMFPLRPQLKSVYLWKIKPIP